MVNYCKPGEVAYEAERRFHACTERAREFVAWNLGKFPPNTLPHVIAEEYDRDEESRRALEKRAYP